MSTEAHTRHAGAVLMVGYEGDPQAVEAALSDGRAGGVILFSRNIESAAQVQALTRRFRNAGGDALPIAIDQEGGRVARLSAAGLPPGPAAREVAQGGPGAVRQWGRDTGRALKALGININFAPVLDVDTNPDNPIIGDRAYGSTPEQVIEHAREAIRGLLEEGVFACGKHFPGHGDTDLDSHLTLPTVSHGAERLERVELAPFAALAHELPAIMTAHVVYPAWDPEHPATLSPTILTDILRQRLGFTGVIVSDDLEMAAVDRSDTPDKNAVAAIAAGADFLQLCKTEKKWRAAYQGLVWEAEKNPAFAKRLADAAASVRSVFWKDAAPVH
ncbi:MAG: beta-N-acetylhexosaminidase [Leptospirillia bacterium]